MFCFHRVVRALVDLDLRGQRLHLGKFRGSFFGLENGRQPLEGVLKICFALDRLSLHGVVFYR